MGAEELPDHRIARSAPIASEFTAPDQVVLHRPLLKAAGIIACLTLACTLSTFFPNLLLTLIVSGLSAFILRPIVRALEFHFGMRRAVAIALVFVTVGGLQVYAAVRLIPPLIGAAQGMYATFKAFPFDEKVNLIARQIAARVPFVKASFVSTRIHGLIESGLAAFEQGLTTTASFVVDLIITPFITYFILADWDNAQKGLIEHVPNKYFEMTLNVLNRVQRNLTGYVRGWILDSVIIGFLSVVGYYILGVDYAIALGFVMGLTNLIPYIGPALGIFPAFLVAFVQTGDLSLFLPIFLFTLAVQVLDNVIIQPLSFIKAVDMHPVTVFFVCFIGYALLGIPGILLAIPVATILKASAVETYWGLKNFQITAS